MDIELRRNRIEDADFAPASFDPVLSSFVLHHLTADEKRSALRTARQLLRPGGELHVADLGPPANRYVPSMLSPVGRVLGGDRVAANISGRLPALIGEAGFGEVAETDRVKTVFGRVAFYRATT